MFSKSNCYLVAVIVASGFATWYVFQYKFLLDTKVLSAEMHSLLRPGEMLFISGGLACIISRALLDLMHGVLIGVLSGTYTFLFGWPNPYANGDWYRVVSEYYGPQEFAWTLLLCPLWVVGATSVGWLVGFVCDEIGARRRRKLG